MPFQTPFRHYFTDYSTSKGLFYAVVLFFVFSVAAISLFEPFLTPKHCDDGDNPDHLQFGNPLYKYNPCNYRRENYLLFLTPEECSYARRLIVAGLLGGVIGWERREADRPAGIRTMALVSLGSALFTINSAFAFLDGPMEWDASRISAAIPSGVGFLGAGLIFKENEKDEHGTVNHVVHGLTTSASLWLSAAVGVACAGRLYFAASFGVSFMLVLLRFGPRFKDEPLEGEGDFDKDTEEAPVQLSMGAKYESVELPAGNDERSETSSLIGGNRDFRRMDSRVKGSVRQRPHLGGIL